jgi:hypothetical protein
LIRYASRQEIAKLKTRRPEKLYYVIDDDLAAAQTDVFLPADYRKRLAQFTLNVLPHILDIASEIVAPSRAILDAPIYNHHEKSLLDPAYVKLCPDLDHFKSSSLIRCIVLGTRSHRSDIAAIAPAITAALTKAPNLAVTTFLGRHAPPEFIGHPRIDNRVPLPWPAFRDVLQTERYHIALAPALPTDFNRARSISRIFDHAAFGAAGIYSGQPPFSERITHGKDGLLLDADPQSWTNALSMLADDLQATKAIAAAGVSLARRLGDPERVRGFWRERLENDNAGSMAL